MDALASALDDVVGTTGFSGVVRVDIAGDTVVERADGLAHRAHGVPITAATQFAIASGTKGFTAVAVMALIESGAIALDTTARSLLGSELPLVGDDVTVEHLLAHRSGIGDYLDEETLGSVDDYVMPLPVHALADTEDYLRVLDGHETKSPAGTRFAYCNSGYVILALLAERAAGVGFHEVVDRAVCRPAGMSATAFLRSDELPGSAAVGYLGGEGLRSNVLHLPVRGSGDGGIYSTAADVAAFWTAFVGGRLVPEHRVAEMIRPRSQGLEQGRGYGLGFWLDDGAGALLLEGYDAGVSFRSVHVPARDVTYTVMANTSNGAWPVARRLRELLSADAGR